MKTLGYRKSPILLHLQINPWSLDITFRATNPYRALPAVLVHPGGREFGRHVTTVPLICDGFVPLTAETLEAIPDVWTAQPLGRVPRAVERERGGDVLGVGEGKRDILRESETMRFLVGIVWFPVMIENLERRYHSRIGRCLLDGFLFCGNCFCVCKWYSFLI